MEAVRAVSLIGCIGLLPPGCRAHGRALASRSRVCTHIRMRFTTRFRRIPIRGPPAVVCMKKQGGWVGRERPSLHRMPDRVIAKARTQFAGGIPAPRGTPGEPNPHDLGRAHRPPGSCVLTFSTYEVALTVGGLAALLAAWIPAYTSRRPLSLPIVLVAVGAAFFLLPVGLHGPDPTEHLDVIEHASELVVIVALMGAGLKIDRPFSWRTWGSTWRMLGIAMPVTIAAHRDARCGRRWSCRNQRAAARRRARAN